MFLQKFKQTLPRSLLATGLAIVLSFVMFLPAHAAEYGCGAYGAGGYQTASCTDELSNTGQPFWKILIAAGLILAGVGLLVWSRRGMKAKRRAQQQPPEKPTNSE